MVGVFIVFAILVTQLAAPVQGINATVDVKPDTLNLSSRGNWTTAYIELPEGYDANLINISSVMLGTVPVDPTAPTHVGDYDYDGIVDLMVKFDRLTLIDYIWSVIYHMGNQISDKSWMITLTLTGELLNDSMTPFEGSDTIRVLILS